MGGFLQVFIGILCVLIPGGLFLYPHKAAVTIVGYDKIKRALPNGSLPNELILNSSYVSMGVQSPGPGCVSQSHSAVGQ